MIEGLIEPELLIGEGFALRQFIEQRTWWSKRNYVRDRRRDRQEQEQQRRWRGRCPSPPHRCFLQSHDPVALSPFEMEF